ncbi:MAG: hypothetical protein GY757_20640 [bacterium]|nr:hypothetical protein [bacterium]
MTNQADVYINVETITDADNNKFDSVSVLSEPSKTVKPVIRQTKDDKTQVNKTGEKFPLMSLDESIVISLPGQDTIKYCPITVKSDVDIQVTSSLKHATWTIKIAPNETKRSVPTDVTVNVGQPEPDPDPIEDVSIN